MEIEKSFYSVVVVLIIVLVISVGATIPAKSDGFVYGDPPDYSKSIIIEAFFDPICPDSRASWPPLKQALHYYSSSSSSVSLILHPFALPYHDNSFVACRALHIVNKLNASATYPMLELFFQHQEKFYNQPTRDMSRTSVIDHIVMLAEKAVGNSLLSAVESGFSDRQTDLATRVSFKYGCSRGVYGTPFFFVNGFLLPDAGDAIDYKGWKSIIDPLIAD
ncbi:hypothetical protein GIB67_040818 [Kingdonia uniflora]|uniref:Thioredoxin-like fold domain-containing protein n=1 Tax=Kingdonia uniflora TaxID=39325 RepID=A0A7J7P4F8_9MAGN|nr:hypothetical protein GIB67_040818 [Kingdonia uniflora]